MSSVQRAVYQLFNIKSHGFNFSVSCSSQHFRLRPKTASHENSFIYIGARLLGSVGPQYTFLELFVQVNLPEPDRPEVQQPSQLSTCLLGAGRVTKAPKSVLDFERVKSDATKTTPDAAASVGHQQPRSTSAHSTHAVDTVLENKNHPLLISRG